MAYRLSEKSLQKPQCWCIK